MRKRATKNAKCKASNGDLIHTQHHHNKCTTPPHMGVGPTHWAPLSYERVLCICCGVVVNLSFSNTEIAFLFHKYFTLYVDLA
jgi:hypothetical protein